MANPHSAAGRLLHGASLADATLVVVAVHGRGQSPAYLVDNLIEPLQHRDITSGAISWVLPAAAGNTWYPQGFMAAPADNEPWLGYALETMAEIERELDRPILWLGFSQGACLVAEHVAHGRNATPVGLICLTGGMIGPPDVAPNVDGSLAGMPAYFSTSDIDEWIPLPQTEAAVDAFRAAGADVQLEVIAGREHVISATEVDSVARFLRRVAG